MNNTKRGTGPLEVLALIRKKKKKEKPFQKQSLSRYYFSMAYTQDYC